MKIREIDLPDEAAAIAFILEIQRQQRNLTREAMSYFRGSEYNASKQQHGGNRRGRRSRDQNDPLIKTAQVLAQKYGVGEVTIKRDGLFAQAVDRIVKEYGDEEIQRKLLGADVKLTQGTTRVLLKMNGSKRKKAIDQLLAEGELPRAKKKPAASPQPKQESADHPPPAPDSWRETREVGAGADGTAAGAGVDGVGWREVARRSSAVNLQIACVSQVA